MNEPVELTPEFATAVWGGRRFAHLGGAPSDIPIAEVWLVSDLPHRATLVANGAHRGRQLRDVCSGIEFPLLIKFIDAQQALSVQVHPNDDQAKARGHRLGKSEAWVVLHAEPGSRIYAGVKPGVDRPALAAAVADGRIVDVLHSFEPQPGDLIYLPAGTVHALGGGITIFEVQQSCDVTYRYYDWGRPRQIHVAEALECTAIAGPVLASRDMPIVSPHFELQVHRSVVTLGGDGRVRVLVAYNGSASGCVDVPSETAVVLPATFGECRMTPAPGAWLFECVLPINHVH